MNAAEVVIRLRRERRELQNAGNAAELAWMIRGLDLACQIVLEAAAADRARRLQLEPRINGRLAGELYRAIDQALRYLGAGNRAVAVRRLEAALFRAEAQRRLGGNHED